MRKAIVSKFIKEEIDLRISRAYGLEESTEKFINTTELELYKRLYTLLKSPRDEIIKTINGEVDKRRIEVDKLTKIGNLEKEFLKANAEIVIYKKIYQMLVGR
ncbi:MAG: hypothetical protein AMQ74_01736 [Candidatus Methanofastidiosum methylothiophilum]|uniref:Uncharacterized protein n=1 Tax=Candidatus Methanofastidiosum methylothiophilum TaxID=1705564 RepID=A0A150IQ32_9EURY|nr:MAG: hypothetical protein AMQ74_01736 [Candidatus Methanofastidiosum methylthiophilus]